MQRNVHVHGVKGLATGLALLLLLSASAYPEVMSETSYSLHFNLGNGISFIAGTVTDSAEQIATVPFSVQYDAGFEGLGDTINQILVDVLYDTTKLWYEATAVNATTWPAGFSPTHHASEGRISLQFTRNGDSNSVYVADTGTVEYAYLKFKNRCRGESGGAAAVTFVRDDQDCQVAMHDAWSYSPDPDSGYNDGSANRQPDSAYVATFTIDDVAVSNRVEQEVVVVESAHLNFLSSAVQQMFVYDDDVLQYLGWSSDHYGGGAATRPDTILLTLFNSSGAPEDTVFEAVRLRFKAKCDLSNGSTTISLVTDSSGAYPSTCMSDIDPYENWDTAVSVTMADSVTLQAKYLGDPVTKQDLGTVLPFGILMRNTFPAGMKDSTSTGINLNINWGPQLDFRDIDRVPQAIKLTDFETDDLVSIYQTYEDTLDNYIDSTSGFDTLVTVGCWFDGTGYAPNWNDRYLHPKFIHSFTGNHDQAVVPDTVPCMEADSANGILRFWGADAFDSVEVKMGHFSMGNPSSLGACGELSLYIRGTIEIDSFTVTVTVPSYTCIHQVTSVMDSITISYNDYNSRTITSKTGFPSVGPTETLQLVCRFKVGIKGSCLNNKYYNISHTLSDAKMFSFDSLGARNPQFVHAQGGGVTVHCSSNGTGCSACGSGQIGDPIGPIDKTDPTLPTVFALHQNFPNPFNPVTTIMLDLPVVSRWKIEIYNMLGQLIKEYEGQAGPGTITVDWDASAHSSGIYLYRATAGDFVETRKMMLLK